MRARYQVSIKNFTSCRASVTVVPHWYSASVTVVPIIDALPQSLLCPIDILPQSLLCPIDVLPQSLLCPIDVLPQSLLCPIDVLPQSLLCPIDILPQSLLCLIEVLSQPPMSSVLKKADKLNLSLSLSATVVLYGASCYVKQHDNGTWWYIFHAKHCMILKRDIGARQWVSGHNFWKKFLAPSAQTTCLTDYTVFVYCQLMRFVVNMLGYDKQMSPV